MAQALIWVADTVSAYAAQFAATQATATIVAQTVFYATLAAEVAGIAAVAQSLAPKTPGPEAQRLTFRQAIPQRRRGCGHARMGGPYLLDYAANGVLHRVIAAVDCPVSNVDQYWMHQDSVRIVGGVVQSLPNGAYDAADQRVKVALTYGATGVPSFPALTSEVGGQWPSTSSATGIFAAYLRCVSPKLEYFAHDYPHGQDPQFNFAGDVDVFYDWRDAGQHIDDPSTWLPTYNPVVALVNDLWRNHDYDWNTDFFPALSILTASANVCDEPVPVLNILAKITQDVAAGDTHVHLKSVDGLVSGHAIYIEGQAFTVSGTPSSDGDGGFLVNLSGGSIVASLATGAVASWQSDPASPVTRNRYTANGLWNADEDESTTVRRLIDCMDGFMCRRGSDNAVIILAGKYYEPTVILGGDELIDYTWQPFVENARAINEFVPAFVSPAHDYTQVDTTPWRDDADITARGVIQSQPFAPELVQENSQVMRLAKAKMARALASIETFKFKISALRALGERWVRLQAGTDELSDLQDVVLEIVGDYQITDNGMSVVLQVIKAVPEAYDWDYETEEGEGPAASSRPYAGPLTQPVIDSVTPFDAPIGSGATGVRLAIAARGPDRIDLNWAWRVKPSTSDTWSDTTTNQTAGGVVTLNTDFVPVGNPLDVAVTYITGAGNLAPWSATFTLTPTSPLLDAAIAGLGGLATQDEVDWASQVTGTGKPENDANKSIVYRQATAPASPGVDDIWVKLDGTGVAIAIYAWNGSAWILGADITSQNTAAAIADQGGLATRDSVDGTTIDLNSVATHHLEDDSVTGYEFQVDTNIVLDTTTEAVVISKAITTQGGRVRINGAMYVSVNNSGSHIIRIYRDSTMIAEIGYLQATTQNHGWPLIYIDPVGGGAHTYEVRLLNFSGDSNITLPYAAMELTEYKR